MATAGDDRTPPVTGQFEFTPGQNALLADLADKMRFVGLVALALGVLVLVGGVVQLVRGVPAVYALDAFIVGLIYAAIGSWTRGAGGAFRAVVDTQGADIAHLMDALTGLRKLYTLTYWLCLVGIALVVIALVASAVGGPAAVRAG